MNTKPWNASWLLISMTILASCQGIGQDLSIFSEDNLAQYRTELAPNVPYFSNNFNFNTTLSTNPNIDVLWTSSTATVIDNEFHYVSPIKDTSHEFIAELTFQNIRETLSFDILVKSQLHVPLVNLKPVLSITLDQNKRESDIFYEDYLSGSSVMRHDANGTYETLPISSPLTIWTRGHSTRFFPKRPYRIRFSDNTSLFGMKAARNYILLANYLDRSLVRNSLVTYMSKFYEESMYTLDYRFVDLFINNEYRGQYLLMERVEFHPNRLSIEPNLTLDDAGFMIELDYQVYVQNLGNENLQWFKMNDRPYVVKEPNPLTAPGYQFRHTRFINNHFHAMRQRLIERSNYQEYIDVTNWIHYFLIQEIVKNVDVGWGSIYMVKESGQPIKHMPLWDFDLAIGNAEYDDVKVMDDADGHWGWATYEKNELFTLMMKIPAIRQQFKQALLEFRTRVLPEIKQWLVDNTGRLTSLSQANFQLWPMDVCEGWCPIPQGLSSVRTVSAQLQYIDQFLTTRVNWMISNI